MKIQTNIYRCDSKTELEEDIPVIVEFEYQPAEPRELDYPGCDEEIEITSVKKDGDEFELTIAEEVNLEITCLVAFKSGRFE